MPAIAKDQTFDPGCRRCPRLAGYLAEVKRGHEDYHCAPVAPFGDDQPELLIVGLAPGKHGANATGRPFTGDFAGVLLYETLHRFGYADRPTSTAADDGLALQGCRITNAVKCLPPDNKPTNEEVLRCNDYLRNELAGLAVGSVVLALGAIAHKAVVRALDLKQARHPFGHGAHYRLGDHLHLVASYHCSRYNTQTGRLTPEMFRAVFEQVAALRSPKRHA